MTPRASKKASVGARLPDDLFPLVLRWWWVGDAPLAARVHEGDKLKRHGDGFAARALPQEFLVRDARAEVLHPRAAQRAQQLERVVQAAPQIVLERYRGLWSAA